MKVKVIRLEKMTIDEFADKHELVMTVRERGGLDTSARFYASFEDTEVKQDGGFLLSTFGDGSSPDEAINNYSLKISGETLVIDANTPNRKEIPVPSLTINHTPREL